MHPSHEDIEARFAPSDAPNAWALEGTCAPHVRQPGVLYASHPHIYRTRQDALDAASYFRGARLLVRRDGGPWQRAD